MLHADSCNVENMASLLKRSKQQDWIGNYRKTKNSSKTTRKTKKRTTGYNLFCRKNCGNGQNMHVLTAKWSREWANLSIEEKNEYIKEAELLPQPQSQPKEGQVKKLLNKTKLIFKDLSNLGVSCTGIIIDNNIVTILGGSKEQMYVRTHQNIIQDISSLNTLPEEDNTKHKIDKEALRQRVQDIYKAKHWAAFGTKITYKNPTFVVNGLPDGVIFTKCSNYGVATLKKIIANEAEIIFTRIPSEDIHSESNMDDIADSSIAVKSDSKMASSQEQSTNMTNMTKSSTQHDHLETTLLLESETKTFLEDILSGAVRWEDDEPLFKVPDTVAEDHSTAEVPQKLMLNVETDLVMESSTSASPVVSSKKHRSVKRKSRQSTKTNKRKREIKDEKFNVEDVLRRIEGDHLKFEIKWVGFKKTTIEPEENLPEELLNHFGFSKKL